MRCIAFAMSNQSASTASKTPASASKSTSATVAGGAGLSQPLQSFSNEIGQRRSGSGSSSRSSPAPRKDQGGKPKHKQGKKFRAVDEDAEAEQFSMQNPRSRRTQESITHLMTFSLPPRPNQQNYSHRHNNSGSRRGQRPGPTWGVSYGYRAVDKARYIHANYRFVVDPRGDYAVQAGDADVHLDWNNVLQVIASSTSQAASCPICLGDTTAPRMAKCGHIFCLPCLIRYMHSDDGNTPVPEKRARWKKCPICWDSIYMSDTRPVRWYTGQESEPPREGSDVVLRLVRRRPGHTLAMPKDNADVVLKGDDIPWYSAAEVMDYARAMKGSEDYMNEQYDTAIQAVGMLEKEDELMFGEDDEWTGRAVRMLLEAKEKIKGIGNPPEQPKKPQTEASIPQRTPIKYRDDDEGVPLSYAQTHMHEESNQINCDQTQALQNGSEQSTNPIAHGDDSTGASTVPRTLHEMRHRHPEHNHPAEYLFYQALLHYYLSPLDIRILKTAFGSYTSFPSSILPRVERVSSGHIVDDDLRRRVKYLSHLPYGCEVNFLECDWTDLVSAEILEQFKPMLERRRKRHHEKDAQEEKERIRIEKAEERELAAIRRKRPSIPNDAFTAELPPAFSSASGSAVLGTPTDTAGSASPPWPHRTTSGFASLASPSTSPSVHRTVWGTTAVAPASPDVHATLPSDEAFRQTEDDGWLQGWEKDLLLDHQLTAASIGVEGLDLDTVTAGPAKAAAGAGKKGKKGKKITLMSTATSRRGA